MMPEYIERTKIEPPGDGEPAISVVMPSTGDGPGLRIIEALRNQSCPPAEIVVVHDRQRRGPAWARNRGIESTTGDLLLFLDDDCVPPPDWVARLVSAMQKFDADISGGTYEETDRLLADRRGRREYPRNETLDERGFVGAGGNIAFRRDFLETCQATYGFVFNENLRFAQDWELIIRCRKLGAVIAFTPVRVIHLKNLTCLGYLRHQFTRGIGIAALHRTIRADLTVARPHRSLLWSGSQSRMGVLLTLISITWRKVIGPFDVSSFRSMRDFVTFWCGEKAQGIGFIWGYCVARRVTSPGGVAVACQDVVR